MSGPAVGITLPGLNFGLPGLPPMAFDFGGGPSGAQSGSAISNPFSIPFAFDNSGWIIQNRSKGNPSATGSTGQASGNPNAGTGIPSALGAIPWHLVLIGVGAWIVLKNV